MISIEDIKNDFFKKKSFVDSMSSTCDLFDSLSEYVPSKNPQAEDAKALASDWESVGSYIQGALEQFEQDNKQEILQSKLKQR